MAGYFKFLALTGIIALQSIIVTGQIVPAQTLSADAQEETAKYERYYEIILDNALSDYYREGTFIVDVKATLERILIPKGYEVIQPQEDIKIENLPGLPFIPPNIQKNRSSSQDSLKASGFDARFQLTRLNIKVLVDTSYSDEDVDFVEEAVILIANADEFRGDIISVSKKVFPRNNRAIAQDIKKPTAPNPATLLDRNNEISDIEEEQEEDNEREEVIENSMFPLSPDTIIQTVVAEREKKMFLGIDWNNPEQLIFIIIALGILFLLALFMAISRKTKAKDEEQIMQDMGQTTPVLQNPQTINTEVKTPEPQKGPTVREMAKFEGDKTFIANMCISKPKIVADIISEWIENDEEQGVSKAVKSLISVDDKLLTILKPHISSNTFEMINFGINNFDALTLEDRISETENFRSSITTYKASTDAEGSQNSLFDFVDQLTDQQILHLMKDESEEMISILLAQVAGERAGVVLQKMDDDKRISVLLKMGKINNIPISVYKKVASHFSNKALEISDMKYVAADGVETILNTIETMPLSEQDAYVASIAEQDLELAKKIKKFFIGFDDLPKVKIELIKSALDEIPSETLILALRTAPAAVREKVLKSRTKRDQQLILSEIEMPSEATNSEVEDAQKTILYAVRRKMKTEA
ncbi:MAG: FliG C-terminal domain-containing protein [Bacteroidota bacterium]|nr:FliG C-terminal domain-containing protein [Bacteroidota bacterium]